MTLLIEIPFITLCRSNTSDAISIGGSFPSSTIPYRECFLVAFPSTNTSSDALAISLSISDDNKLSLLLGEEDSIDDRFEIVRFDSLESI